MFENLTSETFNLIEGSFWIGLGIICLAAYLKIKGPYKPLSLFATFILITFGISDFIQVALGSFLQPGMSWLFVWKILDVIGLILVIIWYVCLRLPSTK